MSYTTLLALGVCVPLALGGCGKKDEEKTGGAASTDDLTKNNAGAASIDARVEAAKPTVTCSEKNDVKVVWSDKQEYAPGPFTHSHTLGVMSGMVAGGTSTKKVGLVVLANYDVKLHGSLMFEPPENKGEQLVVLEFMTESVPTTDDNMKAKYDGLALKEGAQVSLGANLDGAGFSIRYYVVGEDDTPYVGADPEAKVTLTESDGALCGSIDYTSPEGSTFKGTFGTAIAKDYWDEWF